MRELIPRTVVALVAGAALACANRGAQPPGGPEDLEPPRLIRVTPDSGATNARPGAVEFQFGETVSDRPARGDLNQYFLISPSDGDPRVSWHRSRISVRPRRSFRPNTAYTITLLPGLADLRGNTMTEGAAIVFSTGAEFPRFGIVGRIFDWAAERPAPGALIQAISRPDSVLYLATSDSLGAFSIGPFGPGRYTLRGIIDRNNNRVLDPGEPWDSTTMLITVSRPTYELLAIARDTLRPSLSAAVVEDSQSVRLTFDRPINPDQALAPGLFRVQAADSTVVPIGEIVGARAAARAKAAADSAAARDSAAAPGARRAVPPSLVPLPTPTNEPTRAAVAPPAAPRPPRPPPETEVILRLAPPARWQPGATYRVTAIDIRNLMNRAGTSARTFTAPRATRPDSSRGAPPRRP